MSHANFLFVNHKCLSQDGDQQRLLQGQPLAPHQRMGPTFFGPGFSRHHVGHCQKRDAAMRIQSQCQIQGLQHCLNRRLMHYESPKNFRSGSFVDRAMLEQFLHGLFHFPSGLLA